MSALPSDLAQSFRDKLLPEDLEIALSSADRLLRSADTVCKFLSFTQTETNKNSILGYARIILECFNNLQLTSAAAWFAFQRVETELVANACRREFGSIFESCAHRAAHAFQSRIVATLQQHVEIQKWREWLPKHQSSRPKAKQMAIIKNQCSNAAAAVVSLNLPDCQMILAEMQAEILKASQYRSAEEKPKQPGSSGEVSLGVDLPRQTASNRGRTKRRDDSQKSDLLTLPHWISELFGAKQFSLLKALWGKKFVPATELIDKLGYQNSRDQQETLRRRVAETNKGLCEKADKIGEMFSIRIKTLEGNKFYFLNRQK